MSGLRYSGNGTVWTARHEDAFQPMTNLIERLTARIVEVDMPVRIIERCEGALA